MELVLLVVDRLILVLTAVAPITPIKSDDAFLGFLKALKSDGELLGYISTKAADDAAGVLSIETEPPVALQLALERNGIRWADLLQYLPVLLEIIRAFRG